MQTSHCSKVDTNSTGERSKLTTESMADLFSDDENEVKDFNNCVSVLVHFDKLFT